MLRLICMLLSCDLPIQLLLNHYQAHMYEDRLVTNAMIHIMNYEICDPICKNPMQ